MQLRHLFNIKSFWKSRNLFTKRFLAAGGINSSKKLKRWMGRSKCQKSSFIPAHPRNWKDTGRIASL